MKFKVNVGGREEELHVIRQGDRLRITHDGETTEARIVHQDGPHFVLEYVEESGTQVRRRRLRAAGYGEGDERQLWVNGSTIHYHRIREEGTASGPGRARSLSASIPAVVSEVLVKEEETVTAGQKLILLESMKMVMPIQAPHDGVVRQINCAAGEAVQPGVPLIEIGAAETSVSETDAPDTDGEEMSDQEASR